MRFVCADHDEVMARIVQYTETGPADVLQVVEIPAPVPQSDEALIEIKAIGVNPIDWKLRSGIRPLPPSPEPYRAGSDAAGIITELGDGVTGFTVGDRVTIAWVSGAYASELAVSTDKLTPLPEQLTFEQGAALGIPAGTAYQALISLGVTQGTKLLIHGGTGGVGQAAVQIAVAFGAQVVATASAPNHDRLRELGAEPVAYGEGLLERLRAVSPGGFDRVLDAAGTDEALSVSLEVVSDPQHVATIVQGARAAELGIAAYSGGSPEPLTDEQLQLRADAVAYVTKLAVDGKFDIEIGSRYELDNVAEAHRESETGHVRGKIVLIP